MAPVLRNQKASASEAGLQGAKWRPESGLGPVGGGRREGREGGSLCLEGGDPVHRWQGNQSCLPENPAAQWERIAPFLLLENREVHCVEIRTLQKVPGATENH